MRRSTFFKQVRRASFVASAVLTMLSTPGAANPPAQPYAPTQAELDAYAETSDASKIQLLIKLAQNGDHDFAERLLDEYPLSGKFAGNRTLYIRGLIDKARGNLTAASKKFRDALADDPSLSLVRAELAKTLVQLDEDDSAKHHLELLAAEAPDDQHATQIRSFIDQVDAKRPYTIGGYVSLAPSTNINGGANAKTIYLPGNSNIPFKVDHTKSSGLGVATGLNGGFTRRLGNDFSFVLGAGVNANLYGDKDANSFSLSKSAELRYLLEGGYIGIGLTGSYQNSAGTAKRTAARSFGPRVSMVKRLGLRDTLVASALLERRDVSGSNNYDGKAVILNASVTHAFNASSNISIGGGYEKAMLQDADASYDAFNTSVSVYKELTHGITVDASLGYRFAEYQAPHLLIGNPRTDKRISANVTLTKRDLNWLGFAPAVSYNYVRNISDVVLNDYDSHAVDFRLTKDF
jgi:outer membrane protein